MTTDPTTADTFGAYHPADAPAEVVETLAKLDALPERYREVIGDAAVAAAENAALRRRHSEALLASREALNAALAAHDLDAAETSANRLLVLGALADGTDGVTHLPSIEVDAGAVARMHEQIGVDLAALVNDPRTQSLDYSADLSRWRGMPAVLVRIGSAPAEAHHAIATCDPPAASAEDANVKRAADNFSAQHAQFVADLQTVLSNRGTGDPLTIAAAAAAMVDRGAEFSQTAALLDAQVLAANAARRAAGLTWSPPTAVLAALANARVVA